MKKIIFLIFILSLFSFSASAEDRGGRKFTEQEKSECLAKGGTLGGAGYLGNDFCYISTKDGGKECHKKSDCEGDCVVLPETSKDIGKCSDILNRPGMDGIGKLDENGQYIGEPIE